MYDECLMMETQREVHELIAQQAPLNQTLDAIACWIEIMLPDAIMAFMCFNSAHQSLSLYPSQRFSRQYQNRLKEVSIGPRAGSFGCTAYRQQQIITEDIRTDFRWLAFRDAAEQEGLRACWSSPVMTATGELLGTFCTYYRQPCCPSETSEKRLHLAAGLVALAILRDRDSTYHRSLSEWNRESPQVS